MLDDLRGKAVLVTGAGVGIGAAAARGFAQAGARVALHYNRSRAEAERVAADIRARGGEAVLLEGDFEQVEPVKAVVDGAAEAFGRLDVLVNNAGDMLARTDITAAPLDLYDRVMNLNARSVLLACQAALPHFRRQGGGCIINVGSIAARGGGGAGSRLYAGAKGFVSTITRGLAKELVPYNVRVNAVSPGVIATRFHERHSRPEELEATARANPMGRIGTAEDCVGAFLFLASEAMSGYVNGQIIEVSGGQVMP